MRGLTSEDGSTAATEEANANNDQENADQSGAPAKNGKKGKNANAQNQQQKPPEPEQELTVKTVPTRIVERTIEGNYRVKGTQPFMIGTREFKIIVTGIVRAEDFNEEGISATKLLDPKFDIVSARKTESSTL
jgi:flagellar L-ring protein precursor FlgH